MSEFEFVFSLFSLVLGLTLVEVLGGFVRSMKQFRTRRETSGHIGIGLLTPLLAVFMMLDVSSYWISIWGIRDGITVGYPAVFLGLIVTGGYYLLLQWCFRTISRRGHTLTYGFGSIAAKPLGLCSSSH